MGAANIRFIKLYEMYKQKIEKRRLSYGQIGVFVFFKYNNIHIKIKYK